MSDNKELLTIAVIAAALMMVLGTSIPSSVLASTIAPAEPTVDSGNDGTGTSGDGGNDESANGNNDEDDSSNDGGNTGSKDDGENDEDSDDSSGDNDGSDSSSGVPEAYLGEYSTCVSDLSSDDSNLSQDDVVDCYGQVFGPNPTHDLGPLSQNAPTSPATGMPGFENMPSALQQPGDQQQMQPLGQTQPQDGQQQPIQQQQQSYPAVGDQQQAQPLGQTQPQEGQQVQPLGQTQPQEGQQLPIEQQQQQQPQTGLEGQHQMSPSTGLPIDAGILDVETIKEIVKSRLAQ
jgi:hypothetical protein